MDTSRDVLLIDSIKRRQALDSMDMNDKPNQSDQLLKDKGKEKPALNEITDHVVPRWASSWKKLGIQLNLEQHLLQNIEKDNENDCEECCSKMLSKWLDISTYASWETLYNALDKLNTDQVAYDDTVDSDDAGHVCHESILESKPLTKLKAKYIKVVSKIKQIIESKQFKVEKLIEKLCLANDLFSTDVAFSGITTVNQLFSHINQYCNIYDYDLLQTFLASLDECDEAVKLLDGFTEELHHSILKELNLMSESNGQLKPKVPMNGMYILKVKYTGDQKCTLSTKNMVQRIIYQSLNLHKPSVIFIGLEEGCITFIYQVSAAVKSYILQHITPNGLALLASHDIKCLIVDGTVLRVPIDFKAQVDQLVATVGPEEQVVTLSILKRIFGNIIQYPDDEKYRQIKLTGKLFSSKVWQYPASKKLMKMSGWIVDDDHVRLRDESSVQIVLAIISLKLQNKTSVPSTIQDTKHAKVKSPSSKNEVGLKTEDMLSKQLDKLITQLNPGDCKETLLTLQTCFKNINLYPHDEKYHQIKLSNKKFYSKVWQYPDGEEFMKMSGWKVEDASIQLKDDLYIQIVLQLLKRKLESSYIQKDFQGVLTVRQFETLISAVLAINIIEIDELLQHCGISSAGRVWCEDKSSINLLFAAVTTHHCNLVTLLVKRYKVNPYEIDLQDNSKRPCIFQIFHQESENFIIQFLSALYTVDVCARLDGFTLLHTAVSTNCLNVLSLFFSKNCKAECMKVTDNQRRTSLHLAYLYGNTEMAKFLLENGADETALDIYGKIPLDYIDGDPELIVYSQLVQNTRKIHSNPFSVEYNYYLQLLDHGIDLEQAVSLTIKEFNWLQEERPTPPPQPHCVNRATILEDLAHFLVERPRLVQNIT